MVACVTSNNARGTGSHDRNTEDRHAVGPAPDGAPLGLRLLQVGYGAPFAISAGSGAIVERLLGGKRPRNLAAFHLIAEGSCWVDCAGSGRIALKQGDVIMMPFGELHTLGSGEAPVVPAADLVEAHTREGVVTSLRHGGDGPTTVVVCGFVQSGDVFSNPVFRGLPPMMVERTAEEPVTFAARLHRPPSSWPRSRRCSPAAARCWAA